MACCSALRWVLSVVMLVAGVATAQAQLFETKAKQALLIDAASGTVLLAKEPDAPFTPA